MSGKPAKQRSRTLKTPAAVQSRLPVYTQPLTGVGAAIERVNQLQQIARKLLGGKRSSSV